MNKNLSPGGNREFSHRKFVPHTPKKRNTGPDL